jgi:hypothetical protein
LIIIWKPSFNLAKGRSSSFFVFCSLINKNAGILNIKSHSAANIIVALTGPELSHERPKGGSLA